MKPKLRALEITPIEHEGEEYFYFNDRLGIASGAAIPRAWGGLLALFNGQRTIPEIVAQYAQQYGEELPSEIVEQIVSQLDEALFLDSLRFYAHQDKLENEFASLSVRPATLAGLSYPDDSLALAAMVDGYCKEAEKIETRPLPQGAKVRGMVVPHIDFQRGGITESLAYLRLLDNEFDSFIVLGIAHSGVRYPFCATPKDFETPVGVAHCDRELLSDLQARLGDKLLAEQYAHKNEHSVEFVAVFLQAIAQLSKAKIVPIICGGFFEELRTGKSPQSNSEIAQFVETLREVVREHEAKGKRVGFIASVDLAHVGSRFGDESELTPERLKEIETEDLQFLQCIESGDAEAMHSVLAKDNNARNVDAHPAVYTFLAAFPELRAQLLDYRQAFDEGANSVVSFAAMTFYEAVPNQ